MMRKRLLGLLVLLGAFMLLFALSGCSSPTGNGSGGDGGGGIPPLFTITNIDAALQEEGSESFTIAIFTTGTSNAKVLQDIESLAQYGDSSSAFIALAGGTGSAATWSQGPAASKSFSSALTSIATQDAWDGSGTYDLWILMSDGDYWYGYKLTINVQGNVTKSAQDFSYEIKGIPEN